MHKCEVCFRHCALEEGQTGFCGVRACVNGEIISLNYGRITSCALDPIEKKPLRHFLPGSKILSIGSYGCNLRCPYCQNSAISWSKEAMQYAKTAEVMTPREIVEIALKCKTRGNVGIAYTYNEPLVGYEFVRDTARIAHENGLKNVLVTNGTAGEKVLEEITPFMDAMNIDLKAFTERFYHDLVKGDLEMVKAFIKEAVKLCHVELTTLIIPGKNDSEKEMHELAEWVSCLDGKIPGRQIPLHVTRFFPQFHMTDIAETPVNMVYRLAETAREYLEYVYVGNI